MNKDAQFTIVFDFLNHETMFNILEVKKTVIIDKCSEILPALISDSKNLAFWQIFLIIGAIFFIVTVVYYRYQVFKVKNRVIIFII